MIFCTGRTPSYDPVSLIQNGFCYTFECEDESDIQNLPKMPKLIGGDIALIYKPGQDVSMYKCFPSGWVGPF